MSDIKVGDMVMIVAACCERRRGQYLGSIFRVASIGQNSSGCICGWTGSAIAYATAEEEFGPVEYGSRGYAAPLWWLKRIPPISELEGERRDEEINA